MTAPSTQEQKESNGGNRVIDNYGKEQLDCKGHNKAPDRIKSSSKSSLEAISKDLSHIAPHRQNICDRLRGLGWIDSDICSFLTQLENMRKDIRAELRRNGLNETDVKMRDDLCKSDIVDFSHLRRAGVNRALEEYQYEVYMLHENKRQRRVMLKEE